VLSIEQTYEGQVQLEWWRVGQRARGKGWNEQLVDNRDKA
jgi:hypothetical protein